LPVQDFSTNPSFRFRLTDLATEQTILNHAKKEAQRTNHQLNDLSRMNEQP